MYIYIYTCAYIYIYIHTRVYIYIYVQVHRTMGFSRILTSISGEMGFDLKHGSVHGSGQKSMVDSVFSRRYVGIHHQITGNVTRKTRENNMGIYGAKIFKACNVTFYHKTLGVMLKNWVHSG